ncbi:MAG: SMI1/KNR4 family protein [Gemmataceae bacterium]
MTTLDLDRIEAYFGLPLPAFYREFMARYPAARLRVRTAAGRWADNWAFTDRPARVIRLNRSVRRRGRLFDGEPWPDEFLVIGRSERGEYFALYPPMGAYVLGLDPSDGKFERRANSLADFADWLLADRPPWRPARAGVGGPEPAPVGDRAGLTPALPAIPAGLAPADRRRKRHRGELQGQPGRPCTA